MHVLQFSTHAYWSRVSILPVQQHNFIFYQPTVTLCSTSFPRNPTSRRYPLCLRGWYHVSQFGIKCQSAQLSSVVGRLAISNCMIVVLYFFGVKFLSNAGSRLLSLPGGILRSGNETRYISGRGLEMRLFTHLRLQIGQR